MIITRFAPSPTGYLHLGGLRTALFSYLWAKKNKGQFRIRIEDTDQRREVAGAQKHLVHILNKLGLAHDGEVVVQSERARHGIYQKKAEELIDKQKAYYCFCDEDRLKKLRAKQELAKQPPHYDRKCAGLTQAVIAERLAAGAQYVVRLAIPPEDIVAKDGIHGTLKFKSTDLNDVILLKSDGLPTYHLASVVDDHEMRITHVIRAEEWIPSLPLHVILYKSFVYDEPAFYHVPLILNKDKSKLSKRQGHVSVDWYLQEGYLPEAILNYVAFLGWNPGDEREIFSLTELISEFSLERLHKAPAIFNIDKLNWFNTWYIKNWLASKSSSEILRYLRPYLSDFDDEHVLKIFNLFFERVSKLTDFSELSVFLYRMPTFDPRLLVFKKSDLEKTIAGLSASIELVQSFNKEWTAINLEIALKELAQEKGLSAGDIFWPVRVALSGQEASPPPTHILEYLGPVESVKRLRHAVSMLR